MKTETITQSDEFRGVLAVVLGPAATLMALLIVVLTIVKL